MKYMTQIIFLTLTLVLGSVSAQATSLDLLFGGATITAGDKLFDEWQLVHYEVNSQTTLLNAANINVTALQDGDLDPGPGLQFNVSNDELMVDANTDLSSLSLGFQFRVSVTDPLLWIKDSTLQITEWSTATNPSISLAEIVIEEDISTDEGFTDSLGTNSVDIYHFSEIGLFETTYDRINFDLQQQIYVFTTIDLSVGGQDTTANLTGFQQRFSQQAVPEPSPILIFGLGLIGLARVSRRTR